MSIALIGPDAERRSTVAKALAQTRRADVREFDSYPPELEHMQRLMASFDVIVLDLDSDPEVVLDLVERSSASDAAALMVYSQKADPKLAIRLMRAGAREFLLLPLEQGAMAEALIRTSTTMREKTHPAEKPPGDLLVFVGSKGGSGVTTVASNVAIALAQDPGQKTLLVDLALPIGDCALCLGIAAGYSTEDALRNVDRLDAGFLQNLLVKHRSGVFVLAAPTKVPEIEISDSAIDRLIAVARQEFDHVIVDVGSRIDVAAKALFEHATTIYLVTQTGISELRNSNRLISQFFAEGTSNLEIVINRFESRNPESVNEDVITKALGRPVSWKIPDDQDAARALQHGNAGQAQTRISRISLEMASSITGLPIPVDKRMDFDHRGTGRSAPQEDSGNDAPSATPSQDPSGQRATPAVTWPTPDTIVYGEKLTFAQLDATASVEGTFVYTPGPGYVLPVGTHTLWVTFTPSDCDAYSPVQTSISIVVTKATPVITWPTPDAIICGTQLNEGQLNASAKIPGRFDYSPALGEVFSAGTHSLSVTFTPTDSANYTTAQASVSVTVIRATPTISWPTPDPIRYGTQLSATQLCAEAPIPGTFEYHPGQGAVLAAGEHKLSVVFNPADSVGYVPTQTSVALTVTKATPAISWSTPDPITHGVALSATQLNASATVPGTLTYSPAAGVKLTPGAHELSVIFTPADTLNYTAVRSVVSLAVIEKSVAVINWTTPSAIFYGTALSETQLNASASVPGTFVYSPAAGLVLAPGRYSLSASFTPSDTERYATAQASVLLEVKASPEISLPETPAHVIPSAEIPSPEIPSPEVLKAEVPSPEIQSTSTDSTETPYTWTFTAINNAPASSAPAGASRENTGAAKKPRETRKYKGAIYEKGEDGQWHLLTN